MHGTTFGMAAGDGQCGLASVFCLASYTMQKKGAAGDSLGMFLGLGKADKKVPPVVHQGLLCGLPGGNA